MERLLTLPAELRLRIYEFVFCDQQLEIDMSEYWEDKEPQFWECMAEPLVMVDPLLASDIWALHWSRVAIVYSEYMGSSMQTSDRNFVFWLYNYAEAVINVLGVLRFREVTRFGNRVSPPAGDHAHRCIDTLNIDLRAGKVSIRDRHDRECTCKHAAYYLAYFLDTLGKMPRERGRLQLRPEDLWTLYECWRIEAYQRPYRFRPWTSVSTGELKKLTVRPGMSQDKAKSKDREHQLRN
jgi:hypothetical protein